MKVEFKYAGQSGIVSGLTTDRVALATNQLREAAYFRGELAQPVLLRDALQALHSVVVSDLKYRPRDRVEFRAWLEQQDQAFLRGLSVQSADIQKELESCEVQLATLNESRSALMAPFYKARKRYFNYAYTSAYETELLLDPVITVHPDELSFEAFSLDESVYGRVAAKFDLFRRIDEFECGTTNVDFSSSLSRQFQKMRSYRSTEFEIGAGGIIVRTGKAAVREKRIDLPESWLNGFHQVQSVMALGMAHVRLAPIDVFNICRFLARNKAKASPRALRFELVPGERPVAVFEPWEHAITLSHPYEGPKPERIRTWGRRRLSLLERLLPGMEGVDLYLAGHGLPSVWVCDLGDLSFTLALSGWTDQDWTGGARFSLLTRRLDADPVEVQTIHDALKDTRYASEGELAERTGLGVEKTRSAASFLCQAGRAMFDIRGKVFRYRDLFGSPFHAAKAIARAKALEEFSDPEAKAGRTIFQSGMARFTARRPVKTGYKLSGSVRGSDGERVRPLLSVDHEGRIVTATCTCKRFRKHRLTKGPCQHMLALRLAHMSKLDEEDQDKDLEE